MKLTLDALFICETQGCQTIAMHRAAMAHERETGHNTLRLTDGEAAGLRQTWRAQGRCWMCGARDLDHDGCAP